MSDKAIITCALTGVLTDPRQHPVPVTPEQMAGEARAAFAAGAAVMHVHFRQQAPGRGHLSSWEPDVAVTIMQAIRDACPGVILNETTGVTGPDFSGPLACLRAVRPEIAACNAGSVNYLKKVGSNGELIEQLARYARDAGRDVASAGEAPEMLGLRHAVAA